MFFFVPILKFIVPLLVGGAIKGGYDYFTDRDSESERRGEARAKTEYDERLRRFELAMQEMCADEKGYFDVILALTTVGYAYAAACHGKVTEEKRGFINDFVAGMAADRLPPNLREELNRLSINPPNVETAYEVAMALIPDAIELCDMVIALLAEDFDESNARAGREFSSSWEYMKAAA